MNDIDIGRVSTRSNTKSSIHTHDDFQDVPPIYTIDLSLPPEQRYIEVAQELRTVITGLTGLFDQLLDDADLPKRTFHFLARLLFRRVYSKEQHQELRGFHNVTGVPMYLLIAFNVLLDCFMGCTSGGVLLKEPGSNDKRMVHFRTLDWGMPDLREAIVHFEYKTSRNGPVVARVINYVGYVGVVTGVRQGLSVSLNFRPYHNNDGSTLANIKFYGNQLLILLGLRPSISSNIRSLILPNAAQKHRTSRGMLASILNPEHTLADIAHAFPPVPSTACYLTFCDGKQTFVLEKDRVTAKPLVSTSFIATTNHDVSYETSSSGQAAHVAYTKAQKHKFGVGMEEIVAESMQRKECIMANWKKHNGSGKRGRKKNGCVELETLVDWISEYPITNQETHFATIMDPEKGEIAWIRRYDEGEIWEDSSSVGDISTV
ncbi:beta subunit of N-acylethanolamine-hydrolyzing acid amidase-domain-containing protein [Lophiotrema nucula]|uniref:ceramidase n=1 Tax=Lophiotrema nucula TaxID=690887 RepID=A0A6A5Z5T8_9PLEO|nr:beta subunit of N-acylethanolamine-hydrolyzing acid amidase-domain-containing protein [Lophiotrema nucula]